MGQLPHELRRPISLPSTTSIADETRQTMGLRGNLFAMVYDRQMAKTEKAGLGSWRRDLIAQAHGDVIEIGAGTGANVQLYGPAVTSLIVTEPEKPMLRRLEQ